MPYRPRLAWLAATLLPIGASLAAAQPPIPQPEVPAPVVVAVADPTASGVIDQALRAAIEGVRLQGQPDPVGVIGAPPVVLGNRGVRINVPGVRINVPGVQIGPEPPAVVAGPPPRSRLPELARRSWESSDRLFAAVEPAARADEATNRLLAAARQYASGLRALGSEPGLSAAEIADVARLNHAVLGMLDALALQHLASAAGPNGPGVADLRPMAAAQAAEALETAQLSQTVVVARPNDPIPPPFPMRPSLALLSASARELLGRLSETDPGLPHAAEPPAVVNPPVEPNALEPIP